MKFLFRVDSSIQIGTGHLMRCITLADHLSTRGGEIQFVCTRLPGNRMDFVQSRGYRVHELPYECNETQSIFSARHSYPYKYFSPSITDASYTRDLLLKFNADWLVIDHYGIDHCWESQLIDTASGILVIDDLANRPHLCDLLVDQNPGRQREDYINLVPNHSRVFTGTRFAILRPEFKAYRISKIKRNKSRTIKRVLISMGGSDPLNATSRVIKDLKSIDNFGQFRTTIVMGSQSPGLPEVLSIAQESNGLIDVLTDVSDMAKILAESDIALGAAGISALERCCLGIPSLIWILAANQRPGARALEKAGAVCVVQDLTQEAPIKAPINWPEPETLRVMSQRSLELVDGKGCFRVADLLLKFQRQI